MNESGLPEMHEIVANFMVVYGYSTFWQMRDVLPKQFENDFLALAPAAEAALNFAKRFKYYMMIDEQTGLAQGPYPIDQVKPVKARNK